MLFSGLLLLLWWPVERLRKLFRLADAELADRDDTVDSDDGDESNTLLILFNSIVLFRLTIYIYIYIK